MIFEPLKNKTYPFIELLHDYEKLIIAKQDMFVYEGHVRSAVNGLKKELKYKYKTDFISYDTIIQLVDKWFEDVI